MVFCCTCHGYVLWPRHEDGTFDEKKALNVPFGLAHLKYERVDPDAVPAPVAPPPRVPRPSEALADFLAAISNTDAFVETSAEGKAGTLYRFADSLLGTLRAELTRRIDALKSRGA
jgi:hypothetical protein